jgi:hypothetical protein
MPQLDIYVQHTSACRTQSWQHLSAADEALVAQKYHVTAADTLHCLAGHSCWILENVRTTFHTPYQLGGGRCSEAPGARRRQPRPQRPQQQPARQRRLGCIRAFQLPPQAVHQLQAAACRTAGADLPTCSSKMLAGWLTCQATETLQPWSSAKSCGKTAGEPYEVTAQQMVDRSWFRAPVMAPALQQRPSKTCSSWRSVPVDTTTCEASQLRQLVVVHECTFQHNIWLASIHTECGLDSMI